ncbi:metallophosphoesterase family protein [Telmatocola sphagniphila]|jgi:putative phosphoesterase|uniref:Metallophosphoesterase family protein n=1 Tax=Telmatocola sphagniphila TaxID=1123043 RepID=A0A8E6B4T0_9BACT|nr:metallophosphoesterase family protein [Telmatocola sphagniphila]QVL31116.1 metallophosphoesterase family protein [Telmatocola sphagniphila]
MRILLVSDIHGNWQALQAVQDEFDICLFLGDLVDYGPEPSPCIEWVRKNASYGVRGNHDHGAAQRINTMGNVGFRYLTSVTRPMTIENLTEDERGYLSSLPLTQFLTLDGKRFMLCHASPWDPMDEYAPPDLNFWAPRLEGLNVDYVCVGHTHIPYTLKVGGTTVINPGSIGLPRDGDPRCAYAMIIDHDIQLKRVDYAAHLTMQTVHDGPLPPMAKNMLEEVYTTGKLKMR